jgi:hypothetical protein
LFDDYCRRTGGNNALLIICDQLEAQDSSKAWHHLSVAQKQRFGKIVAKMMLKPEDVGSYGSCSQVLPKLSTNDYFQSRCIKGEADGSRTFLQQVVLKPHEQAANVFIQSSGATVKAVTASQVEYMLLNHSNEKVRPQTPHETKSTLSWQTCHSLETPQQQTNA